MMAEDRPMRVRLIGLDEVVQACDRIAQEVLASGLEVDMVVGVARGGFMPARFFIRGMDPMPQTREAIVAALQERHELTLSAQQLEQVIHYNGFRVAPACSR